MPGTDGERGARDGPGPVPEGEPGGASVLRWIGRRLQDLFLRLSRPRQAALAGDWTPPALRRTDVS